jgi:hypothetical protein
MTNLRKLVSDLNTLCDRLDEDYNINYGGCCYVAYILMKNFEAIGIHPVLVIESDCDEIDGDEFLDCVHDRVDECNGLGYNTCCHYFVQIPKIGYVNSGSFSRDSLNKFKGLSAKDVQWIYKTGDWNSCYETKNNAMVGRRIKQVFSKYEDLFKE